MGDTVPLKNWAVSGVERKRLWRTALESEGNPSSMTNDLRAEVLEAETRCSDMDFHTISPYTVIGGCLHVLGRHPRLFIEVGEVSVDLRTHETYR